VAGGWPPPSASSISATPGLGEAPQSDALDETLPHELSQRLRQRRGDVELHVAVGTYDQHGHLSEPVRETVKEQKRRRIGPVQIFENQQ
jgi:hypothetical protein